MMSYLQRVAWDSAWFKVDLDDPANAARRHRVHLSNLSQLPPQATAASDVPVSARRGIRGGSRARRAPVSSKVLALRCP
jgi:hypothetical protein